MGLSNVQIVKKFYLQFLSTEVSFCIYNRPLTGIKFVVERNCG